MPSLTISANINNIPVINGNAVAFNDIYLDQFNNIALSTDLLAVLEECAQAARTLLGECIFNTNQGIPYQQVVWIGVPNIPQFTAALRLAFLNVTGVTEVIRLDVIQTSGSALTIPVSSQSADMLTYNATIQTIYGSGVIQ
jgi:hypothetical protein